jgi:cardiolipin synthase
MVAAMRHLPNAITGMRFLLIPFLVLLLLQFRYEPAFWLFAVSAASDLADGVIARRWNLRTRLGAIADPLADKLTMLSVTLVLDGQHLVPLWLAVAIVLRDVVIVGGGVAYHFLVGRYDMAPSLLSKANTVLEFLVLAAVLANVAGLVDAGDALPALFVLLALTVSASGVQYVWVWGRKAALERRAA